MPSIGEIRKAQEVGFRGNPNIEFIWHACIQCREERWIKVESLKRSKRQGLCKQCYHKLRGINSSHWKGGKCKSSTGYIEIKLQPDDFFYPMVTKSGYVREHRLVMAKHLNRCLLSWEVVHHKNGIKDDNRIENLHLLSCQNEHNVMINRQLIKLQKENKLLKEKLQELQETP